MALILDRAELLARVRKAVAIMEERDLTVCVTGSLARGDDGPASDVDFLVTHCPSHWRYRIEGLVEDVMGTKPFDVIYLDELTPGRAGLMQRGAKRVEDIAA